MPVRTVGVLPLLVLVVACAPRPEIVSDDLRAVRSVLDGAE
jgi:hypothetical protein